MGIKVLNTTTKLPITTIGERAGICWGANTENEEKNYKRGLNCINSNHGRTLEFVNIEMVLDGYSARVIREWYTHIGGAPTRLQASTRYINYNDFEVIEPLTIRQNPYAKAIYKDCIQNIKESLCMLSKLDVPREDVVNLLPLGMTTKIVDKRNLRNLVDMSHQRLCNRAYWEYRELFEDICEALKEYDREWKEIVENLFKPKCVVLGKCPEEKGCGASEFKHLDGFI